MVTCWHGSLWQRPGTHSLAIQLFQKQQTVDHILQSRVTDKEGLNV